MKPLFLIADDTTEKRKLLERFVQQFLDVDLLVATTTEEAKELISEHIEIFAAFIDYQIPTENGPAIIRHLKKHNPDAHIALVTATDSRTYEENARNAGAEAFVCTAWPLNRVEEVISTLLAEWNGDL